MRKILFFIGFFLSFIVSYSQHPNYGDKYKMLSYINEYRLQNGLNELKYDTCLEKVAKIQAEYLYTIKNAIHTNPNCPTLDDRYRKAGYTPYGTRSEIVNAVLDISDESLKNLEKKHVYCYQISPKHNIILLYPDFNRIGIYTIFDGKDTFNVIIFNN